MRPTNYTKGEETPRSGPGQALQRFLQLGDGRRPFGAALVLLLNHLGARLGDKVGIAELLVDLGDLAFQPDDPCPAGPAPYPSR